MIPINHIYLEDCLEGMKKIETGSMDAIITDLPYGVLNRKNKAAQWDQKIPLIPLWEQYQRISKPDSPIILFSQGRFSAELILSRPDLWKYNLIWKKNRPCGHLNANRMPLRQHEDILVFYQKLPVYHPQMTLCPPEQREHSPRIVKRTTNHCYGNMRPTPARISDWKYPTSIINIPKEHNVGVSYHPTQKPVKLIEYLIKTYTDEGDIVLDSCMGSGTTALAAIRTGRHFIGFETEKEFFDTANCRIEKEWSNRKIKETNGTPIFCI